MDGETVARHGRAAEQQLVDQDTPDIGEDGDIYVQTTRQPQWVMTEFWVVTKENPGDFVVVKNSDGLFIEELLSKSSGIELNRVNFDLDEILSDFPGQWVGGFKKRNGRVQSGMLYGDDIEDDTEMGDPYKKTTNKNVIGPKIGYRGDKLKVKVGSSGWTQIVSPGTYPREAYLCFIRDIMLNYIS